MNVTKKHLGSGRNRIELTEINNPNDAEAMLVLEHFLTENRPSDDDEAVCLSLVDDNERVPVLIRCKAKLQAPVLYQAGAILGNRQSGVSIRHYLHRPYYGSYCTASRLFL